MIKLSHVLMPTAPTLKLIIPLTIRVVLTSLKFNKVLRKQKMTLVNFWMEKISMTSLSVWFKKEYLPNRSKGYLAKIRGQTLVVNNEVYSVEKLKNLDKEEKDLKNSPTPNLRAVSEPSTPTTNQTFSEDSLQLFLLNTPQVNSKNLHLTEKIDKTKIIPTDTKETTGTEIEKKEETTQNKVEKQLDVKEYTAKEHQKEEREIRCCVNGNKTDGKKEDNEKKKINIPKERTISTSNFRSRVSTRQQYNQ
ncbi:hypothetical protein JTB14_017017 [Gonioctena quinquepunctata]|nr:hypothetical protein JTB14_017017 [Gonioctena quinquepunctata]